MACKERVASRLAVCYQDTQEMSKEENNEGYICPSCMETFKTAEDLMIHHDEKHASLCPVCFAGFASGDQLKNHFEKEHGENVHETESQSVHADEKQKVDFLKHEGSRLLEEIQILKACLKQMDEPDADFGAPVFSDENYELFVSNDDLIVQFCVKTLKSQEVECTVSFQLMKDLEEQLKAMEKEHEKLQKNLERISKEKTIILDEYDTILQAKEEELRKEKLKQRVVN